MSRTYDVICCQSCNTLGSYTRLATANSSARQVDDVMVVWFDSDGMAIHAHKPQRLPRIRALYARCAQKFSR